MAIGKEISDMYLYENIKRLRKELGISQEELAKKTGYTDRSSITKIEQGKVDLSIDKIHLFAKALGVSASELMGNDGIDFSTPEKDALMLTNVYKDVFFDYFSKLNEAQQSAIIEIMKSMINE